MKTKYCYLILLLLCLSQTLRAQDTPLEPMDPMDPIEGLGVGASVTKRLIYHDSGLNTANCYRFSTFEPLLFHFEYSNFNYNRGWGDPLPQTTISLKCQLVSDAPGTPPALFSPFVDGKTKQFLSSGDKPLELPAGNYEFVFTGRSDVLLPSPVNQGGVMPTSVVPSATYFFDLHVATEAVPQPDPDPDDEALPPIPPSDINQLKDFPASAEQNSVCTFVSRDGSRTVGDTVVNYVDDLGRSTEMARKGATIQGRNLFSLQEYDAWGRKGSTWLAAAKDTVAGAYVFPDECKVLASRTNSSDSCPYTEPVYEASPLNRIIRQYGPGLDWHSKGKAVNIVYTANTTTASELRCLKFTAAKKSDAEMTVTSAGYYAAGSLQVVKNSDEDGKVQLTFTDRKGNVVLSRQTELKESTLLLYDTYYIYDVFDNLQAVLPPELSAKAATSGSLAKAELDKYAYLYFYDSFYRVSERKLPGADWERFKYDDTDHLILSQDGNLLKDGQWKFSLADKFGRICLEGVCAGVVFPMDKHPDKYAFCEYVGKKGEHYGYNIEDAGMAFPVFHKVYYYDNYRFLEDGLLPTAVAKDSFQYVAKAGYGKKYVSPKGSLTGSLTMQMGGSNGSFIGSTFYYDSRARLIQSHVGNQLNGVETECTAYNFSGQPLKRLHIHSAPGKTTQSEVYSYTYDEVGLPLTTKHKLGNSAEVLLSDKEYDVLGRLSKEKRNGNTGLLTGYAYNIRSWLTGISGSNFTQHLYYNADGLNNTKCYNGNISSMTWKAGNESTFRTYTFTYDPLNRLQDAVYGEGSSGFGNLNGFSEQVTGYDKNGNILGLKRRGQTGANTYNLIDNLTLTLNGNQLKSVNDAVSTSAYNGGFEFQDGAKLAEEYAYDLNGNLTKDLNKNIDSIQYNYLNLPSRVTFSDGSTLAYTYSADGVKLRTVHKIGSTTTTTDYCGNVIYENGTAKRLLTEGGYLSLNDKKYHYYLQDHQGNNRVVASSNGSVEETNHYYPFGGVFASTGSVQPYKYNGKELDTKKGLNWYDYGARHYDAALGRWQAVDPSSEKYFGVSPYVYCNNSPVKNLDLDGRDWYMNTGTGELYYNEKKNQSEIEFNSVMYTRIGGNDMLGDMKDVVVGAYSFSESLSLANAHGYSINPIQELRSEVSREQPYSTGRKTVTIKTGEIVIVNEKYGIFSSDKSRKKNIKTDPLFNPKRGVSGYIGNALTKGNETNLIERNYFTYTKPGFGEKVGSAIESLVNGMEVMTGTHDYRNVTVFKNWNDYSKTTGEKSRMLKYRK